MSQKANLNGKVCLVTGATRGIGKGIALQLAKAGAFVYITGRTLKSTDGDKNKGKGSLMDTAREIEDAGGKCCVMQCDHSKDEEVKQVFEKIEKEQNGQLDVLVNNAFSAVQDVFSSYGVPFWELSPSIWDSVNNVGLRNHYVCSTFAAKLMVAREKGLIVNISSMGGLVYFYNVAYGIGKAAFDRMTVDCAVELKKHGVAVVSMWPGPVKTEMVTEVLASTEKNESYEAFKKVFSEDCMESPEFVGIAIRHLATDPKIMKKSGRVLFSTDLASEYGFVDVDGKSPLSVRSFKALSHNSWISSLFPRFVKLPHWVFALYASKF